MYSYCGGQPGHTNIRHASQYRSPWTPDKPKSPSPSLGVIQARSTHPEVSSTREVLPVLVEGDGHDAVRRVERLLDAVPVVNIDIDVQHPLVVPAAQR